MKGKWSGAAMACTLGLALVSGCIRDKTTIGYVAGPEGLVVEDPSFAGGLLLEPGTPERTAGGDLRVQVAMKNLRRGDYRCQYQFLWYDGEGMLLPHSSTPWRQLTLHGHETKVVEAVSTLPGAETYRIQVRRAN